MNIYILPGSFKPPHKGHLKIIENLIKKNTCKIIISITKKSRPLDSTFLYPEKESKENLQLKLKEYFPNKNTEKLNKNQLIKLINNLIKKNKILSINEQQSFNIWNIYLKYLKKKYKNIPEIIIKKSESNNLVKDLFNIIRKLFHEKKNIILLKSEKNKENTRFNLFERSFKKYIEIKLFPDIKDIDATGMRKTILDNNKNKFIKYLPNNLSEYYQNKIWNICKIY